MHTVRKDKPRIVYQSFTELPVLRCYNVSLLVNAGPYEGFKFPLTPEDLEALEKFDSDVCEAVQLLNRIEGVEEIAIDRHSFKVAIGVAFTWDEGLHDEVITVMKTLFDRGYDCIEVEAGPDISREYDPDDDDREDGSSNTPRVPYLTADKKHTLH